MCDIVVFILLFFAHLRRGLNLYRTRINIGYRTVKSALAVTIALLIANFIQSNMPLFSALGAMSAMSRTPNDSLTACRNQLVGTICGCTVGCIFLMLFPVIYPPIIGFGVLIVIFIGNKLKIYYSIPLSCVVFICLCLYDAGTPLYYSLSRFFDTSIGLIVSLCINLLIKPYNNRRRISNMIIHFIQAFPEYLEERVINGLYPDLKPLKRVLRRLDDEINIFERQKFPRNPLRKEVSIYLRGCEQLAQRMYDELNAICSMDSTGLLSKECYERMKKLGLTNKNVEHFCCENPSLTDNVLCYHLNNALDAYEYLKCMHEAPDEEILEDLPVHQTHD